MLTFPLDYKELSEKRICRFKDAVEILDKGLENHQIRNADLQNAKRECGYVLEIAFREIKHRFQETLPDGAVRTDKDWNLYSIRVSSINDVKLLARKLEQLDDVPQGFHDFVTEFLPLSKALDDLKGCIVKGRIVSDTPKEENPDKISLTCPCCIRKIAVNTADRIVDHGFRRPGYGSNIGGCFGVGMKPLEVSDEGLRAMIKALKSQIQSIERKIAKLDSASEIEIRDIHKNKKKIGRDDPDFQRFFDRYAFGLKSDLRYTCNSLENTEKKLKVWKPDKAAIAMLKKRREKLLER